MFNFNYTHLTSVVAWILLIVSSSTMSSCSHMKKRIKFYPSEYLFPDSNLVNGKTFIYRSVEDTNELRFQDFKIITEEKKDYLLERQYSREATHDSVKYTIDGKIVESYIFMGDSLVNKLKGIIVRNEVIDNGSRLGKKNSIIEYNTHGNIMTIRSEEYFLKDTVINWKGYMFDCIKTRKTEWIKLENKTYARDTEFSKKVSEGYFAKGIGLIRYSGNVQGKSGTMELIEIRDISEAK